MILKKVKFTHFHAENFGKFQQPIQHELGNRVLISGSNGAGKSTIKRIIMYILGTKDENGKEISGIRPHNSEGIDIDGLTTVEELTVSVDGAENTIKRVCFQEKNRQGEYTGKDNLQYFVDDVKKGTKKAYEEFVSTIIPATVCISAQELLMKDTAGRRKMLEPFLKHTNDDVIDENPQFEELREGLRANTAEELKKDCRDKIKDRTKKRDEKIVEIRVEESKKVDIDLAELELLKNALNEQINEVKEKQANVDKQFEEYDKQSKDILDLHFELNGLQQQANKELARKRLDLRNEEHDLCREAEKEKYDISYKKTQIHNCERYIEDLTKELEGLRVKYTEKSGMEFDENELTCQMCGQPYPQDKAVEIRMNFHNKKNDILHGIAERGNEVKKMLQEEKEILERDKKELERLEKGLTEKSERIEKVREKMRELPESIDISDREDVKQLKQQIAEKEAIMQKSNSASEIRKQLQDELEELQRQLNEVQKQFDKAEENNRIDERVAELKKQQLALSQEIADIERELDLLKRFERKKAELLESDVNENFDLVKFRMFKELQNGELGDICSPYVNGTSYDTTLNYGAKILAEIDVCLSFQKLYEVECPILLDNSESIDQEKIPDIPNQIIRFMRTDNKELRIETE